MTNFDAELDAFENHCNIVVDPLAARPATAESLIFCAAEPVTRGR